MWNASVESKAIEGELTFVERVSEEFAHRKKRAPSYSLRRFAKSISVDPSFLSKLLSGKRPFNPALIRRIGSSIGMAEELLEKYVSDVSLWGDRQPRRRRPTKNARFQSLKIEDLSDVGEWYHFAILSLAQIESFSMEPVDISERLGIPIPLAIDALHALVRKGILVRNPAGKLIYPTNRTTVSYSYSTETLKRLQKSYLQGAIRAMDNVPLEERDQTGVTMAIDKADLPKAKEKIKRFRRELMQTLENTKSKSEVYHFSISLFPISECGK